MSPHRSPVPGIGLAGYCAQRSVAPGETAEFMVGGPPGQADYRLSRLIHGDPDPNGPGVKEERVPWDEAGSLAVEDLQVPFGSYIEVPDPSVLADLESGFTVALWFKPTLLEGRWHALASKWAPGELMIGMFVTGDGVLACGLSLDGASVSWLSATAFASVGAWQFAAFTFDPLTGTAAVYHGTSSDTLQARTARFEASVPSSRSAPFRLGACGDPTGPGNPSRAWAHFNGRLAHPVLLERPLDLQSIERLAGGEQPAALAPVHAAWDLAEEVSGRRVVDVSGAGRHGVAVNAPTRAVTGPRFDGGPTTLFGDAGHDYGAIHLHEDDLEDAGWPAAVSVEVPVDAEAGIHALIVEGTGDRLSLPFIVRPLSPRHPVAFLVPTLTWQAYSTNNQPWSYTEDGAIDQGACLYNHHLDGSPVHHTSRLRPTRSGDPSRGFRHWGAHNLTANLYLVDWLEHHGFSYDTYADEDLDRDGSSLLDSYRCLILGSHPEYWTGAMLKGLHEYVEGGGRVMYLGGNALFWVTSLDRERPHLMEVRKERAPWPDDYPNPVYEVRDGERLHSSTLEIGGTWRSRGHPPSALLGVEYDGDVFENADGRWGYERHPESRDPRLEWIFDGVTDRFGWTGLNLGSAVGFELDGAPEHPGGDPKVDQFLLARASHPVFEASPLVARRPVSDVVLRAHPNGAAVFSAGSVTWTGSLSEDGYRGAVSRMTENVLRRFLDKPPGAPVVD